MIAGPKAEPMAVQAKRTRLNIFSGKKIAITAERKITTPVTSLDCFKGSSLSFNPTSKLMDEAQTNI